MKNLEKFLIEAKKETYANAKVEKVASNRLGSKDYEYKKDNIHIYHFDVYRIGDPEEMYEIGYEE